MREFVITYSIVWVVLTVYVVSVCIAQRRLWQASRGAAVEQRNNSVRLRHQGARRMSNDCE